MGPKGEINWSVAQSGERGKKILIEIQRYLADRGLNTQIYEHKKGKYKSCYQLRFRSKAVAQGLIKIISPYMKFRLDEILVPAEMVSEKRDAGRRWTSDEDEILKTEYVRQSRESLSAWLGRPVYAIQARVRALGLSKVKKWSAEDERWMLKHWVMPLKDQANFLGRSTQAVNLKRAWLRKHGRAPQDGKNYALFDARQEESEIAALGLGD